MKQLPIIEKFLLNNKMENVSRLGAFPSGVKILIRLTVPRSLGCAFPILRIRLDGTDDRDIYFDFVSSDGINDIFEAELSPDVEEGLFFYTFVFPKENGAYFTSSYNNVDFELSETDESRFCMMIYEKEYKTPDWLKSGVMYQIFVDRFCRGEGEVKYRDDSVINEDWYSGVPQYGERAGAFVENNMFFGGNLWGVAEKLNYLKTLGVSVIYLNPIFEARSNHKYDISNYLSVDGGFGGDVALENLLKKAKEKDIKIILDGVFNHTGDDSLYFDRYNKYGGAYSNPESEYFDWYTWKKYPEEYESWWGIKIMPRLNQNNKKCRSFFTGSGGVAEKYIKEGIDGWRLDVADELNDDFLDELRYTVKKASNGNAAIIGEVWENAAQKISYGKRRRYLRGKQLDSVMNYPLRSAIIDFVKNGDSSVLYNTLTELYSSYPREAADTLMNIIGTPDTERILTVIGGEEDKGYDNKTLASMKMTQGELLRAKELLKIASTIQFTVFGIPSLYSGDEAGVEGYHDPFCRKPFPWGKEDAELILHYKKLGEVRNTHEAFNGGDFDIIGCGESHLIYERKKGKDRVVIAVNRGEAMKFTLHGIWKDILTGKKFEESVNVGTDKALILEKV